MSRFYLHFVVLLTSILHPLSDGVFIDFPETARILPGIPGKASEYLEKGLMCRNEVLPEHRHRRVSQSQEVGMDALREAVSWLGLCDATAGAASLSDDGGTDGRGHQQHLVSFRQPHQLKSELGKWLPLSEIGSPEDALDGLKGIAACSVNTNHPAFLNQLYGGTDPYGLSAEILSAALNTNQYTYEVAPSLTLCEEEVIRKALATIGFPRGDGLLNPGGSLSCMYGMILGRHRKFPEVKTKGLSGLPPLVAFTSQDSHYSLKKGSNWLGLGTEQLVFVETDSRGRMVAERLGAAVEETLARGKLPFLVNATAGTTVLGAFDPLSAIADICEKYSLWMHVDACWGGSVIFSKSHSKLLEGIHRADSVSWNFHKMLGAPLQCSLFLTKEKELLKEANRSDAKYLFQQDKMYDPEWDCGDKSVQCGRKTDCLKVWTIWKARGDSGLASLVDRILHLARYFLEQIRVRDGFKLVLDEIECTNVCFWYIPKRLRHKDENEDWWKEVYSVVPRLKKELVLSGELMISYQPLGHRGLGNFFRFVLTAHPPRDEAFIDRIIHTIERHGQDL